MLQQPIYSLFVRLIPESFLIIYSICLLTNTKTDNKKILLTSIIGGVGIYITRLLPIHFGVHTILGILLYIVLSVNLIKVTIHKAIAGTLISTVLCFISDVIVILLYTKVFSFSSEIISGKSLLAVIASVPSLIVFYFLLLIVVYIKRMRVKNEQN